MKPADPTWVRHGLVLGLLMVLAAGGPAFAANFCVDTAAELQAAFQAANENAEDDTIRIETGTYAPTDALVFESLESHSIRLLGGYQGDCFLRMGGLTRIDGQGVRRGLYIYNGFGDTVIEGLTFTDGLAVDLDGNDSDGGGLRILSDTGDIRVDRSTFFGNRSDVSASAALLNTLSGRLTLRNSLAFANVGHLGGAFVLSQGVEESHVTGNTIVANMSGNSQSASGLSISGPGNFILSNNIIWGNQSSDTEPGEHDFYSSSVHSRHSNDIGIIGSSSVEADATTGEISVDPQFSPCRGCLCFNFELSRNSPLVDVGTNNPAGGMTAVDLAGKPRIIGPGVDIGAYENDRIFADGFD
jgi:hypothetical protein